MVVQTTRVAPSNLMIFISDPMATDVPAQGEPIKIRATAEIITVPCRYWNEGDTEITLGAYGKTAQKRPPDFDTIIGTPSHRVVISDVDMTEYLGCLVSSARTRIRIWTNDARLPDRITIGVGE